MSDPAPEVAAPAAPLANSPPYRIALLLGVASLVLYVLTSPPGITWKHSGEDGAEFAAVGKVLGITHPTGYPLYTLLLRLASVGAAEPAWRATLISNLAAAAAVFCAFLLFWRVARLVAGHDGGRGGASLAAAALTLIVAISPVFWSQAMIIEVYALHLFLVTLLLNLAFAFRGGRRSLWILAWIGGLALTHHMQALLVGPSLLLLAVAGWTDAARRGDATRRFTPGALAGALLLALLPLTLYLALFIRSSRNPPLDWGNPEALRQLWWVMRGEQYRFRMFTGGSSFVIERARDMLLHQIPAQFAWTALPLGLAGIVALARRPSRAPLWALLLYLGLQLGFALNYNIPDPDAYFLPVTLVWAALSAAGAAALIEIIRRRGAEQQGQSGRQGQSGQQGQSGRQGQSEQQGPAGLPQPQPRRQRGPWRLALTVALAVMLAGPIVRFPHALKSTSLRNDTEAEDYAREAFSVLPHRALVMSDGDGRTFSLWYKQVTTQRYDLNIIYKSLLVWPWYLDDLKQRDPELQLPEREQPLQVFTRSLITENMDRRPVYSTFVNRWMARTFVAAPEGPLFRLHGLRRLIQPPDGPVVWKSIDLSAAANADFRCDPFTPGSADSSGLFPGLGGGAIYWGTLPLMMARPQRQTGRPSVITTARLQRFDARLALSPEPTRMVVLLMDGGAIGHAWLRLGEVRVHYTAGPPEIVPVQSYDNVWDFHAESYGMEFPEEAIAWNGPLDQSLSVLPIPTDANRTPAALEVVGDGPTGEMGVPAGYTVFAATQWLVTPGAHR